MLLNETSVKEKKAGKRTSAIVIAIVVHLAVILIATLVTVLAPRENEPQIVAQVVAASEQTEIKLEKSQVVKQAKEASASAAASPIAKMIRANTSAEISAPEVTKFSDGPIGLGEGDFGDGFGDGGGGGGMGSGASFFGSKATGNRFLFVLDHSRSMKNDQVRLRDTELQKTLKALPSSVQYQVLLFAGGGYYAQEGWSVKKQGKNNLVSDPRGKTYLFKQKGDAGDYEFDGSDTRLPTEAWLQAIPANIDKTIKFIAKDELFGGTDWEVALRIAHYMDPPPDVIFFMADGTGGNAPKPILDVNRRKGSPVINTIAMQTKQGAQQFNQVANGTKGQFKIVLKGGKAIDGKEYFDNPAKYNRDLN